MFARLWALDLHPVQYVSAPVPLPPLSLAVVGANFPNPGKAPNRRFEIALCAPGDLIELRPEPKNEHDENAVAVYSERGVQIGYITAERAPLIGQRMRAGFELVTVFQEATQFGAVIRVGFDGKAPELPPQRPQQAAPEGGEVAPEQDWWPDEEWPD